MKEQNQEKNLEVSDVITTMSAYVEKNKKNIIIIICAAAVLGLAIWAYFGLYLGPRQQQAQEEMYAAEQWFDEGDFEKALNGNDEFPGFLQVMDEYGNTKAGNLAKYYAGVCELNLGKYDEAISHLKGYKGNDTFTGAEAIMLIGDAHAELKDFAEAASCYEKAAKAADNAITAPAALWKAGMMHLKLGDNEKAAKCFQTIKDNYNESTEWTEADKYIALAENAD